MDGMRTGLRHRLQRALRRVEEQHRHLGTVEEELDRALTGGAASEVASWVGVLRDALRAHFELEEQVVFPALHGLVPGFREELEQLERDHAAFLGALDDLVARRDGSPSAPMRALRERLARHEQAEERLMRRGLADAD